MLSRIIVRFSFLLLGLSLFSPVFAGDIESLYDATVQLENGNNQDNAARIGLQQVLVKVSGNRDVLHHALIKANLTKARDFLLSYQFDVVQQQRIYTASFDQQKVDKLLRSANLPIWGKTRPATLFWLAEQPLESYNRTLISEQSDSEIKHKALMAAKERGLDLSFPLLDLDDLMNVSTYDVWGRFAAPIMQASQRYDADSLIIARMFQYRKDIENDTQQSSERVSEVFWKLDWQFVLGDTQIQGSFEDAEYSVVIQQLIDQVADQLSSRYAIEAGSSMVSHWLEISVNNVSSLEVYENVRRFIQQLPAVADVTLSHLKGRQGTYKMRMIGTEQDLLNALKLDSRMQRVVDHFGQPVEQLEFVWAP